MLNRTETKELLTTIDETQTKIENLKQFKSAINPTGEILTNLRNNTHKPNISTKYLFKQACAIHKVIDPYHSEKILPALKLNEFKYNQAIENQPMNMDTEWFYYDQTKQFHPVDCNEAVNVLKTYYQLVNHLLHQGKESIINA